MRQDSPFVARLRELLTEHDRGVITSSEVESAVASEAWQQVVDALVAPEGRYLSFQAGTNSPYAPTTRRLRAEIEVTPLGFEFRRLPDA
jgi:hypothetical protein